MTRPAPTRRLARRAVGGGGSNGWIIRHADASGPDTALAPGRAATAPVIDATLVVGEQAAEPVGLDSQPVRRPG